jgi:tRNA threonylcarbamoyladenosine biosynthesis protein TsaE
MRVDPYTDRCAGAMSVASSSEPDRLGGVKLEALTEMELCAWAEALGTVLRSGDVMLLEGPMGAGKTTLTRAVARGLGVDRPDRVRSPTFNICLVHEGPVPLWHVDLFRLSEAELDEGKAVGTAAFEALGLEALADRLVAPVGDERGVLVIEWADLWAQPIEEHLRIDLSIAATPERRDLRASARGKRHRRRLDAWVAAAANRLAGL